ncbi:branched chain amino acid aminotransferase, partial [Volvox carteri f. nagariensis]
AGAAATVDWSRVRLGVDAAPTMFVATWSPETGRWSGGELLPYGPLNLLPAAQVLNYGQSIFEGMKAYRCCDGGDSSDAAAATTGSGRVRLFRPDANGARFAAGAVRMCMPPVPQAIFLAAVHAVVRANVAWVPPAAKGSLYVRPLLLGTGPLLGLCPAPSYTFVVYAVPVGSRAKGGRLASLDFLIHDSLHRAAPRGVGSTKAAGNYSPCLRAQADAREAGCQDCIYLDARSDTYLEEGSGCNIFTTHGSLVTTPPAAGSILPGITRASLLQLAVVLGYSVREAPITVQDAMKADEMFASGTAMVVQPIGSITYKGRRPGSLAPGVGPVTQRLYSLLTSIQYGRAPDPFEWMIEV